MVGRIGLGARGYAILQSSRDETPESLPRKAGHDTLSSAIALVNYLSAVAVRVILLLRLLAIANMHMGCCLPYA
jgi:hypothetical protein